MSAYLKFFQLEHAPFESESKTPVVLGTKALRDAFEQIQAGLDEDAPRICVNGRSGLGKTSLARALPRLLDERARTVVLFDPAHPWHALRGAIVRQLDLEDGVLSRQTLLARRSEGLRLVVVIDAAERIDRESLEHLDILLAYRTDDDEQLVHCVLLANLEHAEQQHDCPLLWWLDTLNTLQLEFAPIPVAGVRSYIVKHLKRAGWAGGELFSGEAALAIHRYTGGVPRSVSSLCEQVLEVAAERGLGWIDAELVEELCGEATNAADSRAAASIPTAANGLDAFFGPTSVEADERPTAELPEQAVAGQSFDDGPCHEAAQDDHWHADEGGEAAPSGGLRWLAAAIVLGVLAVAGFFASTVLSGSGGAESRAAAERRERAATSSDPANAPQSVQQRLNALNRVRPRQQQLPLPLETLAVSTPGAKGPLAERMPPAAGPANAEPSEATKRPLVSTASAPRTSGRPDVEPAGEPAAKAPPAPPARIDPLYTDPPYGDGERHF